MKKPLLQSSPQKHEGDDHCCHKEMEQYYSIEGSHQYVPQNLSQASHAIQPSFAEINERVKNIKFDGSMDVYIQLKVFLKSKAGAQNEGEDRDDEYQPEVFNQSVNEDHQGSVNDHS